MSSTDKPEPVGSEDVPADTAGLDKQVAPIELPHGLKGISEPDQEGPIPAVSSILSTPPHCKNALASVNETSKASPSPPFPRYRDYDEISRSDTPDQVKKSPVGHHSAPPKPKPWRDGHQTRLWDVLRGHLGAGSVQLPPKPPTPHAHLQVGFGGPLSYADTQIRPNPGDTLLRDSNGCRGGRRGGRGPDFETTPAGVVSRECQKRGFNPEWHGRHAANGMFQCSVNINGTMISCGRDLFPNAQMAKDAVAYKALDYIRTCPIRQSHNSSPLPHRGYSLDSQTISGGQGSTTGAPEHAREDSHEVREKNEKKTSFLSDFQGYMGINFPKEFTEDPKTAAAFLEGVALGARMAQSVSQSSSQHDSSSEQAPRHNSRRDDRGRHRRRSRSTDTRRGRSRRRNDDRRNSRWNSNHRRNNSGRSRSPAKPRRRADNYGGSSGEADRWVPFISAQHGDA